MSNELSLSLKTPLEQLIPAMIAWNNTELMERVESALVHYRGVTYTDDQIGEAKKDKAELNAFIKVLNDERIRIGKAYSSPYDKFKAEVDEVITKIKEVVTEIDTQVVAYDTAKKEEKQNDIIEYFKSVIGEFSGLIPYEKVHNPKWLNVSVRLSAVKADIDKIIEDAKRGITAIEALHSEDEEVLKAYFFRNLDLGAALTENERLKQERARVAELKAKKEAEAKARAEAEAAQTAAQPAPAVEQALPDTNIPAEFCEAHTEPAPLMQIDFRVIATKEQFAALRAFLIQNHIKYTKI